MRSSSSAVVSTATPASPTTFGFGISGNTNTLAASAVGGVRYERVVLRLAGEGVGGRGSTGIGPEALRLTAQELSEVYALGVQIGVVVGGGNIFRGLKGASAGMDRAQSDYMGML